MIEEAKAEQMRHRKERQQAEKEEQARRLEQQKLQKERAERQREAQEQQIRQALESSVFSERQDLDRLGLAKKVIHMLAISILFKCPQLEAPSLTRMPIQAMATPFAEKSFFPSQSLKRITACRVT